MMETTQTSLGTTIHLDMSFEAANVRAVEALKAEGFGVLTEIDVRETMKKKLDIDFRPYKILGVCNPSLAYRALSAVPEIGLLLPCNVTVAYISDEVTEVSLVNPMSLLDMLNKPELVPVAEEASARLLRVASALSKSM